MYPLTLTATNKTGTATQAFTVTVTRAPALRKTRTIRAWSDWRRRHQHRARQAHQRWNAYAETTP